MTPILILGAAGNLGRHLCEEATAEIGRAHV